MDEGESIFPPRNSDVPLEVSEFPADVECRARGIVVAWLTSALGRIPSQSGESISDYIGRDGSCGDALLTSAVLAIAAGEKIMFEKLLRKSNRPALLASRARRRPVVR